MMQGPRDDISTTFSRRKGLQKRHSIASCLKQNNSRPPLKRRVSFSKRKTLHLISKKDQQKQQWEASPKDDKENIFDLQETEEFLTLSPKKKTSIAILDEPEDFETLDDPDILNETMALDMTQDYSSKFFNFEEFDDENDDENNTLSQLVEQDDSLPLPTNYIDMTANDTGSTNNSTSEITFLGGHFGTDSNIKKSVEEAKNDINSEEDDDIEIEMDTTEQLMDLGNDTDRFYSANNEDEDDDVEDTKTIMELDDDFSGRFNILDQLSSKIELSTLTEPISNLIDADQTTDDLSKILYLNSAKKKKPSVLPSKSDDDEDDIDKTDILELDNTTETFFGTQNMSGMLNFFGTTAGRRETPAQTPLNLNRKDNTETISVDEFLSRVHIKFSIFESKQKTPCRSIGKIDDKLPFDKDNLLIGMLYKKYCLEARLQLLESKNQFYSGEIASVKQSIQVTSDELERNNPKCFASTILCRKQLKDIKKLTQIYAKHCWYEDRIEAHKTYEKYLINMSKKMQLKSNELQNRLINLDYQTSSTSVLDTDVDYVNVEKLKQLKEQIEDLSEEYDILSSLPSWKFSQSNPTCFSFEFEDSYKVDVSFGGQITLKFSFVNESKVTNFERNLLKSIEQKWCNRDIDSIKSLPVILDEISFWTGRIQDLFDEFDRVSKNYRDSIFIELNIDQIESEYAIVETTFVNCNIFETEPVKVQWQITLRNYPEFQFSVSRSNDTNQTTQIIENVLKEFPAKSFPYGRFESVCLHILSIEI